VLPIWHNFFSSSPYIILTFSPGCVLANFLKPDISLWLTLFFAGLNSIHIESGPGCENIIFPYLKQSASGLTSSLSDYCLCLVGRKQSGTRDREKCQRISLHIWMSEMGAQKWAQKTVLKDGKSFHALTLLIHYILYSSSARKSFSLFFRYQENKSEIYFAKTLPVHRASFTSHKFSCCKQLNKN